MRARILVVDDEVVICRSCEKIFTRAGHSVRTATSGRQALQILAEERFDLVFTDLKMMDMGGMEVLQTVRQRYPDTVVVIITGFATVASAVETMRGGAFDYLPKPFTAAELTAVLERALSRRRIIQMNEVTAAGTTEPGFEGLIGRSQKMQDVYALIRKVAPTDATVLIVGESGTGKDLTAKAIHNASPRSKKKFFAIDISTLSSTLLESELFGHVRGAFTGATADKPGLIDVADGGTIFLDEIGNLLPETQARLLRVLQEKEFREDLYYRLNVFPLRLPPLRERPEDIPDLALHFLEKYCQVNNRKTPALTPEAMQALVGYHWPGNVRELEHVIERLVILVEGNSIEPVHVSAALYHTEASVRSVLPKTSEELKALKKEIRESSVRDIEKLFIEEALKRNDWNVSRAARDVDMLRSNFQALMKKYRIKRRNDSA
jgi:DNA-binding NtrC family response regulator